MWETLLNSDPSASSTRTTSNPLDSVSSALNLDLESHWAIRQRVIELEALKQSDEMDHVSVANFLSDFDASRPQPSSVLVTKLIEVCLKYELFEKAVEYFVWGRETGNLADPDSVQMIMRRTRDREGWIHIRRLLTRDIQRYYPGLSELRQANFDKAHAKSLDSSSPSSSATSHNSTPSRINSGSVHTALPFSPNIGPSKPSSTVDWIDFVSNPSAHTGQAVFLDDGLPSGVNQLLLRRDHIRQESLKKFTGFALGDRQKRMREEVKSISDAELRSLSIEDHVKLTSVIEEMVWRGMADEALVKLKSELEEGRYLIGHSVFSTLASHFRDSRNVDGMLQLLRMMMSKDVAPDISLVNSMLELHVNVKQFKEAVDLWKNLHSYSLEPNATTVGTMIRLLAEATLARVRLPLTLSSILKLVHTQHITLSEATHMELLHYGIAAQNFTFAKSIFKRLKNPNARAYELILQAHMTPRLFSKFMNYYNLFERYHGKHIGYDTIKRALKVALAVDSPHTFYMVLKHQLERHGMQLTSPQLKILVAIAVKNGYLHLALGIDLLRQEFLPDVPISPRYIFTFLHSPFYKKLKPSIPSLMELGVAEPETRSPSMSTASSNSTSTSTSSSTRSEEPMTVTQTETEHQLHVPKKKLEMWNKIASEWVTQRAALEKMQVKAKAISLAERERRNSRYVDHHHQ